MKHFLFILSVFVGIIACAFLVTPVASLHAADVGIITGVCADPPNCGVAEFFVLINRVINFSIMVAIPLAAAAFAYAGFLFLTAGESSSKVSDAKKLFTNVLIGFVFVLGAWLLVRTITSALLDPNGFYNPLGVATSVSRC